MHYEQVDASVWEKQYQNDYEFDGRIARYVRIISHDQRFNSGNEIRIYKVDGTDGFSEADCNGDRILNHDDLTFLKNYMGVDQNNQRLWNQVKEADFSCNGIIDAYDLMFVASRLDGGVRDPQDEVSGMISFTADKTSVKKGDTVTISVNAHDFVNVYALNFELLLDAEKLSSAVCPDNVARQILRLPRVSSPKACSIIPNPARRRSKARITSASMAHSPLSATMARCRETA